MSESTYGKIFARQRLFQASTVVEFHHVWLQPNGPVSFAAFLEFGDDWTGRTVHSLQARAFAQTCLRDLTPMQVQLAGRQRNRTKSASTLFPGGAL